MTGRGMQGFLLKCHASATQKASVVARVSFSLSARERSLKYNTS